jgi:hypothetical protein
LGCFSFIVSEELKFLNFLPNLLIMLEYLITALSGGAVISLAFYAEALSWFNHETDKFLKGEMTASEYRKKLKRFLYFSPFLRKEVKNRISLLDKYFPRDQKFDSYVI